MLHKDSALVLVSGGMDSATLLAHTVGTFGRGKVETISFDYGSKHNDTEYSLGVIPTTERYQVPNKRVRLDFVADTFESDLLKTGGKVPEGHYAEENMKSTVVPFRNAIMLSIAIGFAESRRIGNVYYANHAGDHDIYPDCRADFVEAMTLAATRGTYAQVRLHAPFLYISKAQIARLGHALDVDFGKTYSCYNGEPVHCGRCGTCVERAEAFAIAGVKDPTEYKDSRYWRLAIAQRENARNLGLVPGSHH